MADDQARIQVLCSRNFKIDVKKAALQKGYQKNNDAYLKIMELGLKEFLKKEVKKSD